MRQISLTLELDDKVFEAAEAIARRKDMSMERLVAECLDELVADKIGRINARQELLEMFKTSTYEMGEKTWTRDDLHDRGL